MGSGTLMAVAPGKGMLAHRNAGGSMRTEICYQRSRTIPVARRVVLPIIESVGQVGKKAICLNRTNGEMRLQTKIQSLPASMARLFAARVVPDATGKEESKPCTPQKRAVHTAPKGDEPDR